MKGIKRMTITEEMIKHSKKPQQSARNSKDVK